MSRTERTRAAIAVAASEIVAKSGLRALSMSSVADAAGLSRATIYNHLRDRDELLNLLGSHLRSQAIEVAVAAETPLELLTSLAHWVAQNPVISGLREHDAASLQAQAAGLLELDFDTAEAATAALLKVGVHADLVAAELVLRWLISQAVAPGAPAEREAAAEILARALMADARL